MLKMLNLGTILPNIYPTLFSSGVAMGKHSPNKQILMYEVIFKRKVYGVNRETLVFFLCLALFRLRKRNSGALFQKTNKQTKCVCVFVCVLLLQKKSMLPRACGEIRIWKKIRTKKKSNQITFHQWTLRLKIGNKQTTITKKYLPGFFFVHKLFVVNRCV